MKNRTIKLLFVFCLLFFSCSPIQPEGSFKYLEGYHVGDLLEFTSNIHHIKSDTLFLAKEPVAKFIKVEKEVGGKVYLQIESLDTVEKGFYIQK